MRCALEEGSLARSSCWRREVGAVVAAEEAAVEVAARLRASSSSSLSSIRTSIFVGFRLSISPRIFLLGFCVDYEVFRGLVVTGTKMLG